MELLVVGFILALLIGLALPALQAARERGRMMECHNNLRNIATCMLNYELTKRQYPGYSNVLMRNDGKVYTDPATGKHRGVSYVVMLLPYLDQPELARRWKTPVGNEDGELRRARELSKIDLPPLICPSDPPTVKGSAPLSYAVNCGMRDGPGQSIKLGGQPRDWPENGVFFDLYTGDRRVSADDVLPVVKMSNDYISRGDGTAQTCMLAENVDSGSYVDLTEERIGVVWADAANVDVNQDPPHFDPPDKRMRINVGTGEANLRSDKLRVSAAQTPPYLVYARPSSFHPKGANMAFCDGKVRFVSEQTDYYVYCLLLSSNGARVRNPGTNQVMPNFNRPLAESWYLK
jgi:prepilin-type processing-associated H-X9-DG protein